MVKRYEARRDYFGGWIDLPKGNQGRYVLYTDYAALEQELHMIDELLARRPALAGLDTRVDKIAHAIKIASQKDALEQWCKELEADLSDANKDIDTAAESVKILMEANDKLAAENSSIMEWLNTVGVVSGDNPYQLIDGMEILEAENAQLRKRLELVDDEEIVDRTYHCHEASHTEGWCQHCDDRLAGIEEYYKELKRCMELKEGE